MTAVFWNQGIGRLRTAMVKFKSSMARALLDFTQRFVDEHSLHLMYACHKLKTDSVNISLNHLKMYPGASFSYTSCCPLQTPSGWMEGYFTMKSQKGEIWRATVPRFHFSIPKFITRNSNPSQ